MSLILTSFVAFGFIASSSLAQGKVSLYKAPTEEAVVVAEKQKQKPKHNTSKVVVTAGNLNGDMRRAGNSGEGGTILLPSIKSPLRWPKLKPGDLIEAEITESILALPDSKVPVRALIKTGHLKGTVFLGEATLERNTKRVMISFIKVRPSGESDLYDLEAQALSLDGTLGLEAEYHSNEGKLFTAEFLMSLISGWSKATISRDKNAWGTYQDVPGTDTQAKKAIGEATSKAAERFAEKVRGASAFAVIGASIIIKIVIL